MFEETVHDPLAEVLVVVVIHFQDLFKSRGVEQLRNGVQVGRARLGLGIVSSGTVTDADADALLTASSFFVSVGAMTGYQR